VSCQLLGCEVEQQPPHLARRAASKA
jgi:hypothetical protein